MTVRRGMLAGMCALQTVPVATLPPQRFEEVVLDEQRPALVEAIRRARDVIGERRVWNVNSTAAGGGVAEMLNSLLAYARGADVDARWLVLEGTPEFFAVTKRLHHRFHGAAGDDGPLGDAEHEIYEDVLRGNAEALTRVVREDDIVVLHDPQTAGLVDAMREHGAHVIWRSHIGSDTTNEHTDDAWAFLLPYVDAAQRLIFTRDVYVPEALRGRGDDVMIIPPSIDAFSSKNQELSDATVQAILAVTGIVDSGDGGGVPEYERRDGSTSTVTMQASVTRDGPLGGHERVILQVSRWDPLKDPVGVLRGFAEGVAGACDAHLVLAGPDPAEVTDDPEGQQVFDQCVAARAQLPEDVRRRVHLVSLSIADGQENGAVVNALQRHATVVVQKSLAEGFGLTVAEAMWKARPVVATRIGGIQDQVVDGESGLLLDDGRDLGAFADKVRELILDADEARRIGEHAQMRIRASFLGARHLLQYLELFGGIVGDHR